MKQTIHVTTIAMMFALAACTFTGCGQSDVTTNSETTMVTVDNSAARALGITNSPVTHDQAIQIALKSVPGRVLEVEDDTESGTRVIDVELQSGSGVKEVTIRASDGGVMKIEADEDDGDEGNDVENDVDD